MSDPGYLPQRQVNTDNTEFNRLSFMIKQALTRVNVATLVRIEKVHTTGRTAAVGTVDVTPLVDQVDGAGQSVPHTTIYGVPYLRLQGGSNAVIVDPKAGDLGLVAFCDRDISPIKAKVAQSAPGSKRRFDYADAVLVSNWNYSVNPVNYVVVDDSGIEVNGPAIKLIGAVEIDGTLHVTGDVTGDTSATFTNDVVGNGTSLHMHKHGGVTTGGGQTGVPV